LEDENDFNVPMHERDDRARRNLERKAKSLKAAKESLPMFKYRNDLLTAIRDFQVRLIKII
jgi:hypothetical protein